MKQITFVNMHKGFGTDEDTHYINVSDALYEKMLEAVRGFDASSFASYDATNDKMVFDIDGVQIDFL